MKMRIRRLQRDSARRQMMKQIPTATAVIVNPTHYAVGDSLFDGCRIRADGGRQRKKLRRARIRKKAMEHQVPSWRILRSHAPLCFRGRRAGDSQPPLSSRCRDPRLYL